MNIKPGLPFILALLGGLFICGLRADPESECLQQTAFVVQNITDFTLDYNALYTYLYSGHSINEMGWYNECQNSSINKYYTLKIAIPGSWSLYMGNCVWKYCTLEIMNKLTPYLNEKLEAALLPVLGPSLNLKKGDIKSNFVDPATPIPINGVTIFSILLVLTLLSLSISGFVFDTMKNKSVRPSQYSSIQTGGDTTVTSINDYRAFQGDSVANRPSKFDFLSNFNIVTNFLKIFSLSGGEERDNNLKIFNGVRVLSMCYVVLGHAYFFRSYNLINMQDLQDILMTHGWSNIVISGYYAVDTFYWMGGFFVAYGLIPKLIELRSASSLKKFYPFVILHRLLRIWPSYAVCIFFYWKILPLTAQGPTSKDLLDLTSNCDTRWWRNLLLIDNLFEDSTSTYCFGWGWYLSNDFQFFLITSLALFLYAKVNKVLGTIFISVLMLICIISSMAVAIVKNYNADIPGGPQPNNGDFFAIYYTKPWVRGDVYFFGLLMGCFYYELKKGRFTKVKRALDSVGPRIVCYVLGLFLINFIIFIAIRLQDNPNSWGRVDHVAYLTFKKMTFVVGLFLVLLPGIANGNDIVHKILSLNLWTPFARVSFSMFLVHGCVILRSSFNSKQSVYMDHETIIYYAIADLIFSFFGGLLLTLLVESPTINLLKPKSRGKNTKNDKNSSVEEKKTEGEILLRAKGENL